MNTSFERKQGKEEWMTPPHILKLLGHFDLDPCASKYQRWKTADIQYTKEDDGLRKEWKGRVFCNPPYGDKAEAFIKKKLKEHNNGTLLIFCRPETKNWFDNIWYDATSILFIKGRLKFYDTEGKESDSAGCASVLVAYGEFDDMVLHSIQHIGKYVRLK